MEQGRVIVSFGAESVVATDSHGLLRCTTRRRTGRTVSGDTVDWSGTPPHQCVIDAIHPRRNTLVRTDYRGREKPLAANLDQLLIVCAPEPEPDPRLVDRYLVLATHLGLQPLLAMNKADLARPELPATLREASSRNACPVFHVSAASGDGLDDLTAALAGCTTLLVGQSGVGKSSLINALVPDRQARTQAISEASGQGRHTTTETTMYPLPGGGDLVDSPGVRILRLGHLARDTIQTGFPEIAQQAPHCEFRDCEHGEEPGCAVQTAVSRGDIHPSRLTSFHELLRERTYS